MRMLQTQFDYRALDIVDEVGKRMKTYEQVMRGVDGLFAHASIVNRSEFRNYISRLNLKESYPGIQGIRFIPIVPKATKDRHIVTTRKEGLHTYTIWPEGQRDLYAPVVYAEPLDERNQQVFGYDMLSDLEFPRHGDRIPGLRRAAMEQARDSGNTTLSGKVSLLFEADKDKQAGFVMFLPIYRHNAPHGTVAERRTNISGWIGSAFRMGDLINGILGEHADVDIEVYDGEEVSATTVMYDSHPDILHQGPRFRSLERIHIADHTWTIGIHSLPGFEAQLDKEKPRTVAAIGAGASLFLALFVWLLVSGRTRALQATAAVARESHKNEMLLRTAGDSIYIFDLEGNVVQVNDAFCRMLGYTKEELLGMNVAQWNAQWPKEELLARAAALKSSNPAFETQHRRRDGSTINVEVSASKVEIDGQQLIYNSARDITGRKRAERVLAESRNKLHTIVNTALDAAITIDADGTIISWNIHAENIFGWPCAEIIGRPLHETIIPPRYREAHLRGMARYLSTGMEVVINSRIEISALHRDGREFPVELAITPIKMEGKYEFNAFLRDITTRKQAEASLRESESQMRLLLDSAAEAIYGVDTNGNCTFCNPACLRMLGYQRADELIGKNMHELTHYRHADGTPYHVKDCRIYRAFLTEENTHADDEVLWRADGTCFSVEYWSHPQIRDGMVIGAVVTFLDISARKKSEETIWKQANFDALTGLPNRNMFRDRLEQELKKAQRTGLPLALILIDLDHFKEINDTLGHDMGDLLLLEAARRIIDCVRLTDTVARLGGDEFIVILPELDDISSVERIAQSLTQKISEPYYLKEEVAYVSASIGITLYPNDADTMEGLFKNADQAMYVAKNKGRNRHSYFTHALQEAAQARLRLINDLRGALAGNQLMVYFQPIVDMATGRINKAEALIRWQHPERGMVSPVEFIPLAEETGLIFEIGDWVFHESMRCAKRWRTLYNPTLQISVNKSPVQFYKDGDDHTAWLSHLHKIDLPGQSLAIEITEGLLMDSNASITGALHTLRNVGIQISMDDFGTGYSSLSYLKKFHIDYLKIDRSFVRDLVTDPNDLALSEAIIVMAHKLGIKVVAEGVETEEQRNLLCAAGCDYAQGYLFSKPVPAGEFEELLKGAPSV